MLQNYFKVIYRNLVRQKTYSIINILGLSAGLAMGMIIMQYVSYEESYDRFHTNSANIYRVAHAFRGSEFDAAANAPTGDALMHEYPEVQRYVRITPEYGRVVLNYDGNIFDEQKVYYADPTFFTMFDFKLLEGDASTALRDPGSIVLSRSSAEKYFGNRAQWKESPLNRLVRINNKDVMKVTGIMEDIPENSHFKANAIISFAEFVSQHPNVKNHWQWNDFYTYIELAPGTDATLLEAKLPGFVKKYLVKDPGAKMILQPLEDIHLRSNIGYELDVNGSAQSVYFLTVISVMILLIAWVNYINLSTARGEGRGKEVSIRKVNGASRREVMLQFMLESFYMNLIAIVIAIGIVQVAMPFLGSMLEKPLRFSLISNPEFLMGLGILYIAGSLLSGIYPAIVLSSFQPLRILKASTAGMARGKSFLRQGLVVFQFMMSVGLITGTMIVMNQMEYMRTKDLGFTYNKTLIINAPSTLGSDSLFNSRYRYFRQQALKDPAIELISVSSAIPGKSYNDIDTHGGIRLRGKEESEQRLAFLSYRIDEEFINVYGMKLIAGRNFTDVAVNTDSFLILNRKGAEHFGFTSPADIVGRKVNYWGRTKEIIGVVENYHHKSLKNNFEPMIFRNTTNEPLYISMRLSSGNVPLQRVIEGLEQKWKEIYPENPFAYSFLDTHVGNQYKADTQFTRIFTLFAFFSIAISCLGLFGLVSYTVTVRIKEIGIRKVLGASVSNIVLLFSKDYVLLMLVASAIGIPAAYYLLALWLENFAYRAPLGWWLFVVPAVLVTLFSIAAVSGQILKAAFVNPVNTLRQE
jgi:putative ABC transport system permease protein